MTRERAPAGVWVPYAAWLAALALAPLGLMGLASLSPQGAEPDGGLSLAAYARLLEDPYPRVFAQTLAMAAATSVACVALSFPAALAIVMLPARMRLAALLAACLPFWVSVLVRVYALQGILGKNGLVNDVYAFLWRVSEGVLPGLGEFAPAQILFTKASVVIGLTYAFVPFALLPIYAALSRIDPRLFEASSDLGASRWTATVKIALPLARPGVYAAAALVFMPCLGAFYIPDMLGGPGDVLLGNLIKLQFFDANNWPFGAAISVTLVLLTLAAALVPATRLRRAKP